MKHFKLNLDSKIEIYGRTLYQIELTIDCKWGKACEKGGFVEKESNVSGDAQVSGNAWEESPLQIQGTKHFFTVSAKGKIRIGCKDMTFENAHDFISENGKENNYSEKQIKEYQSYVKLAIELYSEK